MSELHKIAINRVPPNPLHTFIELPFLKLIEMIAMGEMDTQRLKG